MGLSNSEGFGGCPGASQILAADSGKEEGFHCSIGESVKLAHKRQ